MSATTFPLSAQRALITGGSRGIGLAIAQHLARLGASTLLVSRDPSTLSTASSTLPLLHSSQTHSTHAGTVSSPQLWQHLKTHKDISILINAAGITHSSLLATTPADTIADVLNTNLLGTILACQAMSSQMVRRRGGVIVNIGSVLGLEKPGVGATAYAASKAGVVGFSRALAAEVGRRGVRVNTVVPGFVETEMVAARVEGMRERGVRVGSAEEVADAVGFLVRNEGMQGAEIVIDGGLRWGVGEKL